MPRYTLFYSPGACSMAIHVLLNEVGADFTLENCAIREGKTRTPEFLKRNPRGQIPVLEEDGKVLLEGAAQLIYLAEKFNSLLLPKEGWARAEALQWLMFCNSTLHPAYSRCFWLLRQQDVPAAQGELLAHAKAWVNKLWVDVEQQLEGREYLCGADCTLADVLVTVIANWSDHVGTGIEIGPRTRALFRRVIARPAYQKALQTEQVEYKAAA